MRFRGNFLVCASATRVSSLVFLRNDSSLSSCCLAAALTDPRHFSFGRFFFSASSGCMGLYTAVASRPAYFRMICLPPGCSCKFSNEVSSHLLEDRTYRKKICDIVNFTVDDNPTITGATKVSLANDFYLKTHPPLRVVLCHVAQGPGVSHVKGTSCLSLHSPRKVGL